MLTRIDGRCLHGRLEECVFCDFRTAGDRESIPVSRQQWKRLTGRDWKKDVLGAFWHVVGCQRRFDRLTPECCGWQDYYLDVEGDAIPDELLFGDKLIINERQDDGLCKYVEVPQ